MSIIDELQPLLKRIEQRLTSIESQLGGNRPMLEVVSRDQYACADVSELSRTHGVLAYRPYTLRLACSQGRIPDAWKTESGNWRVPRSAVIRILEEGIPPQRRSGST